MWKYLCHADDERHCPFACLINYISRIPSECGSLFPLPLKQYLGKKYWYCWIDRLEWTWLVLSWRVFQRMPIWMLFIRIIVWEWRSYRSLKDNGLEWNDIAAVTRHKNIQCWKIMQKRSANIFVKSWYNYCSIPNTVKKFQRNFLVTWRFYW